MKNDGALYYEKVASSRTELLFVALSLLFFLLLIWRLLARNLDALAGVLLFFFCFFLFYALNYRTLTIRLTPESFSLAFGIFTWTVPLTNVRACQLDNDLPALMQYGGAGIHFMLVRRRYRVSFNFLEHPRVVIRLKRRAGLVRDISFSTCRPNDVVRLIEGAMSANGTA